MARLDPAARVRRHVEELLADRPLEFEALRDALVARGLDLGPDPDDRLDDVLQTMERVDWLRVVHPDDPADVRDVCFDRLAVLEGTTWTVPISEVDLASDTVTTDGFTPLLLALVHQWCALDGGGTVDFDRDGRRAVAAEALGVEAGTGLALPEGWLADHGARPGGVLSMRLDGRTVRATGADRGPEPSPAQVEALAGTVSPESPERDLRLLGEALDEVVVRHPELRGATMPLLADWIAAAGLVRDGRHLARAGFDIDRERLRRHVQAVAHNRRFREEEWAAYSALVWARQAWSTRRDEVEPELWAEAADALGLVGVASAFVDEDLDPDHLVQSTDRTELDELVRFGEVLVDAVVGSRRAGPAWLIAQLYSLAGLTDRFEAWIDTALDADADYLPALHDKAWFEFDRGEAKRAKARLLPLGRVVAGHDLDLLDEVLAPTRPTARRNDPCPCGSGRKYKHCHLGVDEVPLDARLTWLYRKAVWWLERRHRFEVEQAAWVRGRHLGMSLGKLIESDPLIVDAVLTEGGRFAEWLEQRGAVLPPDEAMLAGQWALVGRSVFEVLDVRLDEGLTVRDVRTGDVLDVPERLGTRNMTVGRYVLARPLPTGSATFTFFGGITKVPDTMVGRFCDLLDEEPTAGQLMQLVAEAESPPMLANSEGHATAFHETTWRLVDGAAAAGTLDTVFEPADGDGRWTWLDGEPGESGAPGGSGEPGESDESDESGESGEPGGFHDDSADDDAGLGPIVRGTLAIDGDRLTANTNSDERAQALGEIIAELLPEAELVEDLRSDLDDLRHDADYERFAFGEDDDDEEPEGLMDPTEAPPELQAALREQMDRYEDAWIDESIPALGGITPRQALDDPTRRDDLFRLLDRMEEQEARLEPAQRAFGMRTSRLRELLGLSPTGSLRLPGL
jgi:hypothetical protein